MSGSLRTGAVRGLDRVLNRVLARVRGADGEADGGFTMLETVVGMVLMSIFLGIFSTAVVSMFNAANKTQSVDGTSSQLATAFDKLDLEIRYASYLGTPGLGTDNNWYVEFQTTNTGSPICTQLRVNSTTQQLQQRTWSVSGIAGATVASNLSSWVPLASEIMNGTAASGSSTQPFTVKVATANQVSPQLSVVLVATDGVGSSATTSNSSQTFTAINSLYTDTHSSPVCAEEGRP